jgi:hypothetical protein
MLPLRQTASLLLLAGLLPAQDRSTVRREPVTVICHFRDDELARKAAGVAEATWGLALEHLRPEARAVAKAKFEVHLYRDPAAYHRARERLQPDLHQEMRGFADGRTMTCHVLIEADGDAPARGLGDVARNGIAHELFHLAIYQTDDGGAFVPGWYAEGLPSWAETEVSRRLGAFADPDDDEYESGYTLAAQQLLERGEFPAVAQILGSDLGSLTRPQRYAVWRLWVAFVARKTDVWRDLWSAARRCSRSPAAAQILRDAVTTRLGADLATLDRELRAYVEARKAKRPAPAAAPAADARGRPGADDFVPATPQVRWVERFERRELTLTAKVTLRAGTVPQADFVLDRGGGVLLRVTLYGGDGVLVSQRTGDEPWQVLARHRDAGAVAADRALALRVAVRSGRLQVDVGGRQGIALAVDGLDGRVRWGVGGPSGSKAHWADVRVQ